MRRFYPTKGYCKNGEKNYIHLREDEYISVINKEAEFPSTKFVSFYQNTLHHFSGDNIFNVMSYLKDTI